MRGRGRKDLGWREWRIGRTGSGMKRDRREVQKARIINRNMYLLRMESI